jgi:uncharacterized protein YfaA (DUF2138 family)
MPKTLLQNITENLPTKHTPQAVNHGDENRALADLMQDMKAHLTNAANDLLQPRQEAVDKLLNKVLH